jgi:hypothetical protein
MRHPAFREPDSILEKLREFHRMHQTPIQLILTDLTKAVEQLPGHTRGHEAKVVADVLRDQVARKRGPVGIGELLTAVLARLGINANEVNETSTLETGDRP